MLYSLGPLEFRASKLIDCEQTGNSQLQKLNALIAILSLFLPFVILELRS
jgi:hypothetical protein